MKLYYGARPVQRVMKAGVQVRPGEVESVDYIEITADITDANQTVKVNKYFSNVYNVDWGDGSPVVELTANTTHTYTTIGEYKIKLTMGVGVSRWTFGYLSTPLVPKFGTTASNVYISKMPSLKDYFGNSDINVGDTFFFGFNANGALTSLPAGSFDTSNITTVGNVSFQDFNYYGALTSLPAGSFDTSNITTVGDGFSRGFNREGALTSLPAGSFDTSNITTVGNRFFEYFATTSRLPKQVGGVQIKNITNGNIVFNYRVGYYDSDTILPGDTFNGYAVG